MECIFCNRAAIGRGLCRKHYQRTWKAGGLENYALPVKPGLRDRLLFRIREGASGCWLWTGAINDAGYGILLSGGRQVRAHRVAYELFVGPIPNALVVCHRCDIRACVNPDHLFIGTRDDNNKDMRKKGRAEHSDKHHAAKLTAEQVRLIRDGRGRQSEIAAKYGITQSVVSRIRSGKAWGRV